MKTLIIYTSVDHGNTEKIAKAIAEAMNADLMEINQADSTVLLNYDQIGFGSGIFYRKHHKKIFQFVDLLPTICHKRAFVFSTSGIGSAQFNAPLESALKDKGFEIVGSFACKGYDTWGPTKLVGGIAKGKPDIEDLKNAASFGAKLI
ncbi:MAG TPA: flavodoxin family protein [Bacillota bacterium]|nr:flavodoxin family protein [Bacillota bacterium]